MVDWNREDSNCAPRSVVTDFGAPNLAIQLRRKALTIVSAVVSVKGIASGHLVKRSMQVRGRYVHVMVAMDPQDQGGLVKILHLVTLDLRLLAVGTGLYPVTYVLLHS